MCFACSADEFSVRNSVKELKLQNCRLDGRYDITECLGRGSYSEIYCAIAVNPSSPADRQVVIKALNVYLQGTPDTDLERTLIENFQNEALALDRVRHPNIIRRLGHGTAIDLTGQPFHYLVLEYLPGGDLSTLCRAQPFRLENALYYLEQVSQGLAYAHACGVIHRDIKPQNLLLTADRRIVKIADFGVAKLNISDEQITRVGTNVYAPPEHSPTGQDNHDDPAPRRRLTPAADIYSLAKTLYTLLAGESPRNYTHRPITALPAPLAQQPWGPGVLRVLNKATQAAPEDRYQQVQDFWQDLADAALLSSLNTTATVSNADPRHQISRELPAAPSQNVPAPPPQPAFEPATALQQGDVPRYRETPEPRARLVVPVGDQTAPPAPINPKQTAARDIISNLPDHAAKPSGTRRSTRLLLALALITLFVGMLLATNYYVKNRNTNLSPNNNRGGQTTPPQPTNPQPKPTQRSVSKVKPGDEGVATTTDINLRSSPNANNSRNILGVIGKGSRVRVLQARGEWAEIQVLEYEAPDIPKQRADQGWLNTKNIDFE